MERRLAAIVAIDVVGYSRLMNEDEEGTHRAVKDTVKSLINPKVAQYRGRIVKLTGDGALIRVRQRLHEALRGSQEFSPTSHASQSDIF